MQLQFIQDSMKIRWAMGNGRMVIFRSSARVVKGMVFKAFLWYTVFHLSCIRKPVSYVYYSEISKFLQGFQFWFFAKFQRGFVRFFDLILRGTLRAFYRIWGFHGNFRNSDKFWQDFGFFWKFSLNFWGRVRIFRVYTPLISKASPTNYKSCTYRL
jgi:hypothetical protein